MTTQEATTKSAFEKSLLAIDWVFNAEPPALRCPSTGEVIFHGQSAMQGSEGGEDFDDVDYEAIPSVMFAYLGDVGDFMYIRPEMQAEIDSKREELSAKGLGVDALDDFDILRQHVTNLGDAPMVFELTTSGMACGPTSTTVWVGLDLFAPFKAD